MTKVLLRVGKAGMACLGIFLSASGLAGQNAPGKPAEALYLSLGQVGLDPARVYHVRGASLDRAAVHVTLEDGTIAFTQDVMGRVTGAFFEGDGEVLLVPPNEAERKAMSLFTGMAILEEHFATGYFRFNDDAMNEMRPDLRSTDDAADFVDHWGGTAKNLANADAMRLLVTFSRMLPAASESGSASGINTNDRFLHARLQGTKLGVFDVYFDSLATEQIQVGQAKPAKDGVVYYDVWTSFATDDTRAQGQGTPPAIQTDRARDRIAIKRFAITTEVQPPQIQSRAKLQAQVEGSGLRALLFELSRYLQVESVKLNGEPVEFIHNPAVEGTQLSRQGNDVVAVILPQSTKGGEQLNLEFEYGGEVLAEAGSGLLYVGARGTWYPNRGMAMADFDLEFSYPAGWTLVATGKSTPVTAEGEIAKAKGEQASHWVSERPIPLAGFNLGKYRMATAQAGKVEVEAYATQGMERNFPSAGIQTIEPKASDDSPQMPVLSVRSRPSPTRNESRVAGAAAHAIEYYEQRFGPYPYSHLALTQIPGGDSQGWPGLIFLSSFVFLDQQQREEMHYEPYRIVLQDAIPAHETAHQWWGDLVAWKTYRDQWFSEGLANYCALMMVQEKNPQGFREIMEKYRRDLVTENKDGMAPKDAGAVTLGGRLQSSRFPEGYEAVSYGRATWLFHMLRSMLKDASPGNRGIDEPFVRALHKVRERYEGRTISTRELLDVFAEELPASIRYEGKNSLDWFLDSWVNGTALPSLELKGVKFSPKGNELVMTGTILQKDAAQDLVTSVPIYGAVSGKQPVFLGRVFADGEESTFRLTAPAGVKKIVLDPEGTVLTNPK